MPKTGYKAFNKDMTNRYGKKLEVGRIYQTTGSPKFGNEGNGFHFCERLEDTLRYFNGREEEILLTKVTSFGPLASYQDEYNGYYDMFATTIIRVDQILSRQEVIAQALVMPVPRVVRFVQGYRLTEEEIEKFKGQFLGEREVEDAIAYYQEGNTKVYEERAKRYQKERK